jgi:hypothetical protein
MKVNWKQDHFLFGVLLGSLLPALAFLLVSGGSYAWRAIFEPQQGLGIEQSLLLSLLPNLMLLRYYLVKLRLDQTGRGVLLPTFLVGIAFFYFHFQS